MSDTEKLVIEIASRLLVVMLQNGVDTNDKVYAHRARMLASVIVGVEK